MKTPLLLLVCLCGLSPLRADDVNLLPEGSFEYTDANGNPELFTIPHPSHQEKMGGSIRFPREVDNRFLRIEMSDASKSLHLGVTIPIPAGTKAVRISYKVRCEKLEVAADPSWASVRLGGGFKDGDGKSLPPGYLPVTKSVTAPTQGDWKTIEEQFMVPEGTISLLLQPGVYFAKGAVDIDDLAVYVVPVETPAP